MHIRQDWVSESHYHTKAILGVGSQSTPASLVGGVTTIPWLTPLAISKHRGSGLCGYVAKLLPTVVRRRVVSLSNTQLPFTITGAQAVFDHHLVALTIEYMYM